MTTSRYSRVLADSTSPPSGPDSAQLPLLSETNTASESSQSIGRECRSSEMLPRLLPTPRANKLGGKDREDFGKSLHNALELSPVGSLANLIPLQESVRLLLMSVTSGASAPGSQASLSLDGPCLKTCRDFYQAKAAHSSPASSVIWPRWGIAWAGGYGALTTLGRFTGETGCSSWPTPEASNATTGQIEKKNIRILPSGRPRAMSNSGVEGSIGLARLVKMWPTPQSEDVRDRGNAASGAVQRRAAKGKQIMLSQSVSEESGALNPAWVEALMGFPAGWTELSSEESREFRKESRSESKGSGR